MAKSIVACRNTQTLPRSGRKRGYYYVQLTLAMNDSIMFPGELDYRQRCRKQRLKAAVWVWVILAVVDIVRYKEGIQMGEIHVAHSWHEAIAQSPQFLVVSAIIATLVYGFPRVVGLCKKHFICKDCRTVYAIRNPSAICPSCGGPLEILDGFYKRHPER